MKKIIIKGIKEAVIIYSLFMSLYLNILTYMAFLQAYFSSTKTVIIHVNRFGEADIEFIYFPILLALIIMTYCFIHKKIKIIFHTRKDPIQ